MPTTILDGETYLEALSRRYFEEYKLENKLKLWHIKQDRQIKTGDIVETKDGRRWYLEGSSEPRPNDPEGEVVLHSLCERRISRSYFPRAIGAEWRKL